MSRTTRSLAVLSGVLALAASLRAGDWPQFLGPERNGASRETGLLTSWSKAGPKLVWKADGGEGYSGIAVKSGKAFTLVQRGAEQLLLALDIGTGKEVWKKKLSAAYKNQFGNGPRSTPTVDGNKLYVQSANGPLVCLDVDGGSVHWEHDLLKEFKTKNIDWGLSASPLIEGGLVIALPGSEGGVVAFNKDNGQLVWHTGSEKAAYASPIIMTVAGKRQLILFNAMGVLALEPAGGKELWRLPWKTEFDVNIATPLVLANQLLVSSGENVGCALLQPAAGAAPKIVWESKGPKSVMKNYWATAVAHDQHLFGISGEYEGVADLNCVEQASGKLIWSQSRFGRANLTLADGHLYIATIDGDLVVVPATAKSYQEKGRAKVLVPGKYINAPAISDKKLYVRDLKNIYCFDIAGK